MVGKKNSALIGAVFGLLAMGVFVGIAELVAAGIGPNSAPIVGIGQNAIVHVPQAIKEFAIEHFGENDKTALVVGIDIALFLGAGIIGSIAATTRPRVAYIAAAILGIISAISGATQPGSTAIDALPSVVGLAALLISLRLFYTTASPRKLQLAHPRAQAANGDEGEGISRRRVLTLGAGLVVVGAGTYLLGKNALTSVYSAVASRAKVILPQPSSPAKVVANTGLAVAGLAPYITPNNDFYRVDTAIVVPEIDTSHYRLKVHGMVDHSASYSFSDLLNMPLIERVITLVCVSNPVGGPYVGNAKWLGVPLAHLLEKAGVDPRADQLMMTSTDGMTIGADLKAAMDGRDAMLAVGMNGEPLPFKHGFPVRAIIPGMYGYASACKWLTDLNITTYKAETAYWVQRGYAVKGPIKLESKIDTPAAFGQLKAGDIEVAGAAWLPGVGIKEVDVRVDEGTWHQATLANVDSVDSWRLWKWTWSARPGSHTLEVRAIANNGEVETSRETGVFPNGASGRESLLVTVAS